MEANAPEKIYIPRLTSDGKLVHEWNNVPFKKFRFFFDKEIAESIEYTRTDVFIEKAAEWLEENIETYISCDGEWNIDWDMIKNFKKAMKGE